MSGLDLDAIEARARAYNKYMEASVLDVLLDDVPDLVAEVRALRAKVERVEALPDRWWGWPIQSPRVFATGLRDTLEGRS